MVQSNTEQLDRHVLIAHDSEELVIAAPPAVAGKGAAGTFAILDAWLADWPHESIVWHHPDGGARRSSGATSATAAARPLGQTKAARQIGHQRSGSSW